MHMIPEFHMWLALSNFNLQDAQLVTQRRQESINDYARCHQGTRVSKKTGILTSRFSEDSPQVTW